MTEQVRRERAVTLDEIVQMIRDQLTSFAATGSTNALSAAVDVTEQVLRSDVFPSLPNPVRALLSGLGASALLMRARTPAACADDLDRAIEWLSAALGASPSDSAERARSEANLATAYVDRYEQRGDLDDLHRAVPHLRPLPWRWPGSTSQRTWFSTPTEWPATLWR